MKLELAVVVIFAAFVPHTSGQQMNPSLLLSMMGSEVRLPPKPPRTVFPEYYYTREQLRLLQHQQRRQQEMQLFRRLKEMSVAELKKFQSRLSPTQLRLLVNRIKFLKQEEEQQKQSPGQTQTQTQTRTQGQTQTQTQGQSYAPWYGSTRQASGHRHNMVLSAANRIRRPSRDPNSAHAGGARPGTPSALGQLSGASRRPTSPSYRDMAARMAAQYRQRMIQQRAAKKPKNPLDAMRKYQSYRKKATSAVAAGCTMPMGLENPMDSFVAFSHGGCALGGATCYMSGQSCVDVGMSIMCCPPGYSSGTLDMLSYMKQLQSFMAQF